jgi:hypothetical protein
MPMQMAMSPYDLFGLVRAHSAPTVTKNVLKVRRAQDDLDCSLRAAPCSVSVAHWNVLKAECSHCGSRSPWAAPASRAAVAWLCIRLFSQWNVLTVWRARKWLCSLAACASVVRWELGAAPPFARQMMSSELRCQDEYRNAS